MGESDGLQALWRAFWSFWLGCCGKRDADEMDLWSALAGLFLHSLAIVQHQTAFPRIFLPSPTTLIGQIRESCPLIHFCLC